MVCACLNTNESSRMAVCSCLYHFKVWLSIRVFLQGSLAISVHGEVPIHEMCQTCNGIMSGFP